MIDPTEARLHEAETQCRFERARRIELAALIGQFIERATPLVNDAGLYLDPREFERPLSKPLPVTARSGRVASLREVTADTARVIFDECGGAITLQIGGYARRYLSADFAAHDVLHWLTGSDPSTWEGHDPEAMAEPASEDIRAGCYLTTEIDRANPRLEVVAADLEASGWRNAADFAATLRRGTP